MSDLISRKAAIDGLFATMPGATFSDVLKVLRELPSAQHEPDWTEITVICDNCGHAVHAQRVDCKVSAQPKKGRWIHYKGGWGETWFCSECGEKTTSTVTGKPRYLWCPMCGADMRTDEYPSHPFADDVMMGTEGEKE